MILVASSIIGATIMPHALIIHSYLAREKWASKAQAHIKDSLKKHAAETIFYLSAASLVNAAIQIMSYYAFYKNGYTGIDSIETAYKTLKPLYGREASVVSGIALLASGLSSSMVSVLAGVNTLESYTGKRFKSWKVRLQARLINIVPVAIAVHLGWSTLKMLVYSQVTLSVILPFILIPLILLTSNKSIMEDLANRRITTLTAISATLLIIIINLSMIIT